MSLDTKDLHIKIHSAKAWEIPDLTGQWTLNTWWVCRLEDWGCKVTGVAARYQLVSCLTPGSYRRWIFGWVGRGALGSFLGSFQVLWWNIDQSKGKRFASSYRLESILEGRQKELRVGLLAIICDFASNHKLTAKEIQQKPQRIAFSPHNDPFHGHKKITYPPPQYL